MILYLSDMLYIGSLLFLYDTVYVVLGFCQYIQVACCLALLYLTAFSKIRKSFKPNPIIPFPLTQESIESLESALLMPTSCQTFYDFINDLGDLQGVTLMALYADIRVFKNLVSE